MTAPVLSLQIRAAAVCQCYDPVVFGHPDDAGTCPVARAHRAAAAQREREWRAQRQAAVRAADQLPDPSELEAAAATCRNRIATRVATVLAHLAHLRIAREAKTDA